MNTAPPAGDADHIPVVLLRPVDAELDEHVSVRLDSGEVRVYQDEANRLRVDPGVLKFTDEEKKQALSDAITILRGDSASAKDPAWVRRAEEICEILNLL